MEQRWGFLAPWCVPLKRKLYYSGIECSIEVWNDQKRTLDVELPRCQDFSDETEFRMRFRTMREALALLAAVEHVDPAAWRYLLTKFCDVELGDEGEEYFEEPVPVRFMVSMDLIGRFWSTKLPDSIAYDLEEFCGVRQRDNPSVEYLEALNDIAGLDATLQLSGTGVDIDIPIRVIYPGYNEMEAISEPLMNYQLAEKVIKTEWEKYERGPMKQPVTPGSLRCNFVLEPIFADFIRLSPEVVTAMETLVRNNVWFSNVSLDVLKCADLMDDDRASRGAFGQLMATVFDSTPRSPELANTTYCSLHDFPDPQLTSRPLQLGTVRLTCDELTPDRAFEAMCTAIVFNQTSKKLEISTATDPEVPSNSKKRWRWLAYALFSKRACACSAVKSLALTTIGSMSVEDVDAFLVVLKFQHPEEELFGCPRGQFIERDSTLNAGAPIRRLRGALGRPQLMPDSFSFKLPVPSVRTFSDDGESTWVNILLPGYGRCQVMRGDLAFNHSNVSGINGGLSSLTIIFDKTRPYLSDGLPNFLQGVGHSLRLLVIGKLYKKLDEKMILRSCPNLVELSLCWGVIDVRLNFSECHARNEPLAELGGHWEDVAAVANDFSEKKSMLSKCVRKLRVRLNFPSGSPQLETIFGALSKMLEVNRSLEYLEVVVPFEHETFPSSLKNHHLEPIWRQQEPLPMESKTAFLSVLSSEVEFKKNKKLMESQSGLQRYELGELVLSDIFEFAAAPVLRKVYFRRSHRLEEEITWDENTL